MSNSDTILRAGHKEPRAGVTGQRAANAECRRGGRTRATFVRAARREAQLTLRLDRPDLCSRRACAGQTATAAAADRARG